MDALTLGLLAQHAKPQLPADYPQQQRATGQNPYAVGYVDPSRLPPGYFDGGGNYAVVSGASLGLDNNYQYAVYPDGHVENLFQGNDPTFDPNTEAIDPNRVNVLRSTSELAAQGADFANAPRDAHGIPQVSVGGINYQGQPQTSITGETGLIPAIPGIAFSTVANAIVPGSGAVATGGMTEGSIGDKLRAGALSYGIGEGVSAGLNAAFPSTPAGGGAATPAPSGGGNITLADSGLSTTDVQPGLSISDATPTMPAAVLDTGGAPMMPSAVPAPDPTFGGALSPMGGGVYGTSTTSSGAATQPSDTSQQDQSTLTGGTSPDTGTPDTGTPDTGTGTPDPSTGGLTFTGDTGSIDTGPAPDASTGGLTFLPSEAQSFAGGATGPGGGGGAGGGLGTDFEDIARGYEQSQADTVRGDVAGVPQNDLDWNKIGNTITKYGPLGLGVAGLAQQQRAGHAAAGQLGEVGQAQRDVGNQLVADWKAGKLTPADAQAIDEWERGAIAQTRQYYANAKQSDSSAAVNAESLIHARAEAMRSAARNNLLTMGLNALNVTDKYQAAAIQAQYGADQQMLANALQFMNIYGAWLRGMEPKKTASGATVRNDVASATGEQPADISFAGDAIPASQPLG